MFAAISKRTFSFKKISFWKIEKVAMVSILKTRVGAGKVKEMPSFYKVKAQSFL